jgi:hypothetical protein
MPESVINQRINFFNEGLDSILGSVEAWVVIAVLWLVFVVDSKISGFIGGKNTKEKREKKEMLTDVKQN